MFLKKAHYLNNISSPPLGFNRQGAFLAHLLALSAPKPKAQTIAEQILIIKDPIERMERAFSLLSVWRGKKFHISYIHPAYPLLMQYTHQEETAELAHVCIDTAVDGSMVSGKWWLDVLEIGLLLNNASKRPKS